MTKTSLRIFTGLAVGTGMLLAAAVTTDYDHAIDFSEYHTYTWLKIQAPDSIWEDRIRRAVDAELAAKGWTQDPAARASVAAFGSTYTQPHMETFYTGFGGGWRWRGFGDGFATTTVEKTPVGMLVVDIFDSGSKKLLWRGRASDVLAEKPDKDEKKMEKAVTEMFKRFPPPPKG